MPRPNEAWSCRRCGAAMHRHLATATDAAVEAAMAALGGAPCTDVVHVCGRCKAYHVTAPDGSLRRMTPAEEFELRMLVPRAADLADRLEHRPGVPLSAIVGAVRKG
jgi:hypothetical protein